MKAKRMPDVVGIRTKLGKTQEEMAVLVGVSLRTVTRWESGTVLPSRLSVRRISEVMAHGLGITEAEARALRLHLKG